MNGEDAGTDGNGGNDSNRYASGDGDDEPDKEGRAEWPVRLDGVTESVVTTLGPNDRWNCAALGLIADRTDDKRNDGDRTNDEGNGVEGSEDGAVLTRTWGHTRTWRNFRDRGEGYVQFVHDPVVFAESALSVREVDDPVLPAANAWVRVAVERVEEGEAGETRWVEWTLRPRESAVASTTVPTIDRGHGAVIEATVAASRLDVASYDTEELLDRLARLEGVIERCGGPREREAFARLAGIVGHRW